jgi:hypothetical protein
MRFPAFVCEFHSPTDHIEHEGDEFNFNYDDSSFSFNITLAEFFKLLREDPEVDRCQ